MKRTASFITTLVFAAGVHAQAANTATLSFSAPTTYTDGSPIPAGTVMTFGVYQALQGVTPKPKVATISTTGTTINTGLLFGKTYCWQVTTIIGTQESAPSAEACKTFPPQTPSAVTGLTVN